MSKKRIMSPTEYEAMRRDSTTSIQLPTIDITGKKPDPKPVSPPIPARLYPKGQLTEEDKAKLKAMKDKNIDAALNRKINKPGETDLYGTQDSDNFKKILKK